MAKILQILIAAADPVMRAPTGRSVKRDQSGFIEAHEFANQRERQRHLYFQILYTIKTLYRKVSLKY